ncbi:hypothetical protein F5144DRAFT_647199 [Chaetomium tenue]|uniref:Uncharacterized protein n=1 Tax=Chaetomium tenue TaxID=1854479 RepID=A0ACB7PE70_9PEZI|nr:hypothetical protein F5144DRAFT_647199 [Chaetomium globosum]
MGTRGLEIVRFHGRYYIRYNPYDSCFKGLGAKIVASIPSDRENYEKWLEAMRAEYTAKERLFEKHVYEIRDESKPDYSLLLEEFEALPSELPRLDGYDAEYFYIINLDKEVLTMNHSIHWNLGNIPREDNLWIRAIADSIYRDKLTISFETCPEQHMASPALRMPKHDKTMDYPFNVVTPNTDIETTRKAFLTFVLARTLIEYHIEILRFGREWAPGALPFRELAFALIPIASGHFDFYSFPKQRCNPRTCSGNFCPSRHFPTSPGWIGKSCDSAPLLEFGSPSHRPGDPAGASPTETMYWFEGVLVSLALRVDGKAVTNAVTWGLEQGRTTFQVVILSLFEMAFAEVVPGAGADGEPFVTLTAPMDISPLRPEYCLSSHPRERPENKGGLIQYYRGEVIIKTNCAGTTSKMLEHFPGLAALVNFFNVAASRRAACKHPGVLPAELYLRILDFVDYDTWKACSVVSPQFRAYCLEKPRLDDRARIVAGPFLTVLPEQDAEKDGLLSFDFEDMETRKVVRMMQVPHHRAPLEYLWMPVIGSDRKAVMVDVIVQFRPVEDPKDEVHEAHKV